MLVWVNGRFKFQKSVRFTHYPNVLLQQIHSLFHTLSGSMSVISDSRTVVRRALLRLSYDKIVLIEPNKGASVAKLIPKQAAKILTKFLKELIPLTSLIIAQHEKPGYPTCSHQEHFGLIDAIKSGDTNKARKMMKQHLQHIKDKLDLRSPEYSADLRHVFKHIVDLDE